jgi:hypothetical protein
MRFWIINFEYHSVKHLKYFVSTCVFRALISGGFEKIDFSVEA